MTKDPQTSLVRRVYLALVRLGGHGTRADIEGCTSGLSHYGIDSALRELVADGTVVLRGKVYVRTKPE